MSLISSFFTYLLFSKVSADDFLSSKIVFILYFDICLLFIFLLLSSNKIFEIYSYRKHKGSKLTIRLIGVFSVISIIPSVMMCIFSAIFFHNGIEDWFDLRNQTMLKESINIAHSYLDEHKSEIKNDCYKIARTLEFNFLKLYDDDFDLNFLERTIGYWLDDLASLKNVDAIVLLDSNLRVVAHSKYSAALHFLNVHFSTIKNIKYDQVLILDDKKDPENIKAIAPLKTSKDETLHLLMLKHIDSNVVTNVENAQNAFNEYHELLKNRKSLEIAFILIFFIVGILLLISSIVLAIVYSWRISKPISNLIDVSEKVIQGDIKARADVFSPYEEITLLTKTFNQMMDQVYFQRKDLIKINEELDERMKFTGSVLAAVSSGVIGIENDSIYIWNNAAEKLLKTNIIYGQKIAKIFPEIFDMLKNINDETPFFAKEIQYKKNSDIIIFMVKIEQIISQNYSNTKRFVVTFDDLTNMIMAQRKAAWSEAARRVAHEIKNPLTPIQLAAERIKRKYLSQIKADEKTFSELIKVIVNQVGDIKRLIDEFNFFARLPDPVFKTTNLKQICEQAIFLLKNTCPNISIIFNIAENTDYTIEADERLIHQSMVNLIQNAINALRFSNKSDKKILVSICKESGNLGIFIEDNGPGFPKEKLESLATPYFTLMPKGTGLGLNIVKKIIQDHSGTLHFGESIVYGGAKVSIYLPYKERQ